VVAFAVLRARVLDAATSTFEPLTSGPAQAVALSLSVVGRYAYTLLFPFRLNAEQEFPVPDSLADPHVGLGALILAAIIFGMIRLHRRGGYLLGFAFLLTGLLPVMHLIPMPETSAERFLYLPSLGFVILAATVVVGLARRTRMGVPVAVTVSMLMVLAYGARTVARNADWKNEATLYRTTVRTAGASARAHLNLGKLYYKEGRYPEAMVELRRALEINPQYAGAWSTLAGVHRATGRMGDALQAMERALRIEPRNANFHNSIGVLYVQLERYAESRASFRTAIEHDPAHGEAIYNLALASYLSGDMTEARINFERVPFKDVKSPHAYFYLAMIAAGEGNTNEAARLAEKFLSVYDKNDAYRERAKALLRGEHPQSER
jgi:Tfp pilus assembly protein PilF